jgi:hydrogenase maturation protease
LKSEHTPGFVYDDEFMKTSPPRCLILACGNTLRGDDGAGPWLAEWAQQHFLAEHRVCVLSQQQWTPELAEDLASAASVLFIDCAIDSDPGSVTLSDVHPTTQPQALATHHLGPSELLSVARDLYDSLPRNAILLTIGAGSTELGEDFSPAVQAALPQACYAIDEAITKMLDSSDQRK